MPLDVGILEKIWQILWDSRKPIGDFLNTLRKQPIAFMSCVLLLLTSVSLVSWYRQRASSYESIVNRTFGADTEETPQSHKGLEAFIFSNVRAGLDDQVRNAHFDPDFIKKYDMVRQSVADARVALTTSPKQIDLASPPTGPEDVYIDAMPDPAGYLFLPAYLIHDQASSSPQSSVSVSDPAIIRAVVFGRSIAKAMQQLAGASLIPTNGTADVQMYLQPSLAQVYVITTEGVNRVFNRKDPHPSAEYGNQFPGTTFFPSRPYFWPAMAESLKEPSEADTIGSSFHVSKPYLDLGGSGVVITLSRPLLADGVKAVLCIDVQLDSDQKNIYTELSETVHSLGGTPAYLDCTIRPNDNPDCPVESSASIEQSQLIKRLKNALASGQRKNWSTVLGNIYVFDAGSSGSRLSFSVPISQEFKNSEQKVKLLLVDVDLNGYRDRTSIIALCAATCFGVMTVLLAYMWGSNMKKRKELTEALQGVAEVMAFSPTPYLRLDSRDGIKDVSPSFCALLGIAPTVENIAAVKLTSFRSYCADPLSQAEYDRVEALRRKGLPVGPYSLELRRKDQTTLQVRVHSAALPKMEGRDLPETFGILVELAAVRNDRVAGHGDDPSRTSYEGATKH